MASFKVRGCSGLCLSLSLAGRLVSKWLAGDLHLFGSAPQSGRYSQMFLVSSEGFKRGLWRRAPGGSQDVLPGHLGAGPDANLCSRVTHRQGARR